MAKFSNTIGFATFEESSASGIHVASITEKTYKGDILRESRQWREINKVNDDLHMSLRISIVADEFALQNLDKLKYVVIDNVKWKITSFENARPRIILTIGGVWNE